MVIEYLRGQKFYDWRLVSYTRNIYEDSYQLTMISDQENKYFVTTIENVRLLDSPEQIVNHIYHILETHPDLPYRKQIHMKKHLEGMEKILGQDEL